MLIVTFQNLSDLAEVSDYEVVVRVNHHELWRGRHTGHVRSEGWQILVRDWIEELRTGYSPGGTNPTVNKETA
jgi:hypothetical protein